MRRYQVYENKADDLVRLLSYIFILSYAMALSFFARPDFLLAAVFFL